MAVGVVEAEIGRLKTDGLLDGVRTWRVDRGFDAMGRVAVWVWLIVGPEGPDPRRSAEVRELVRNTVSRSATEADWVYVSFTDAEGDAR